MEVADNGNGFDVSTIKKGNGLENMIQRAKSVNGEVKIDSTFDAGTTITFSSAIPWLGEFFLKKSFDFCDNAIN